MPALEQIHPYSTSSAIDSSAMKSGHSGGGVESELVFSEAAPSMPMLIAIPEDQPDLPAVQSVNVAPKRGLFPVFAAQPGFVGVVRLKPPKIADRRR